MVESLTLRRGKTERALPRVIVDDGIPQDYGYEVNVDPEGFRDLLIASGIPEKNTSRYTLSIEKSPPKKLTSALGYTGPRTIHIYMDTFKMMHDTYWKTAAFFSSVEEEGNPFENFMVTKSFAKYLEETEFVRRREFSDRLLEISLKRNFRETLIHEASHLNQRNDSKSLLKGLPKLLYWDIKYNRSRLSSSIALGVLTDVFLSNEGVDPLITGVACAAIIGGSAIIQSHRVKDKYGLHYRMHPGEIEAKEKEKDRTLNDLAEKATVFQFRY